MSSGPKPFSIRLPATSANLGSGFDAAAVALNFFLEIKAETAEMFSIAATGQDSNVCSRLKHNLILENYSRILAENGKPATPLAIQMQNNIPLGMGCGSSAAGRLAAIAMAVHFGNSTGARIAFWRRHALWKAILTTPQPAGWVASWPLPTREEQFMLHVSIRPGTGVPSWSFQRSHWRPARPVPCFP